MSLPYMSVFMRQYFLTVFLQVFLRDHYKLHPTERSDFFLVGYQRNTIFLTDKGATLISLSIRVSDHTLRKKKNTIPNK